jgi:methylmalonyl-CoA mutase
LDKQADIDVLVIDNEAVKKQQIERLSEVKAGRDTVKALQSLENLSQAASNAWNNGENGNNCLAAAVECARARCTVGEITDTMAKVCKGVSDLETLIEYLFCTSRRKEVVKTRIIIFLPK